jgi:hypothetical protein
MKFIVCILLIFSLYKFVQSQILQWEEPITLSNNEVGWCGSPSICIDSNGKLFVTFWHYNNNESKRLYFNWFNGGSWQGVDTLYQDQNHDVYTTKLVCDSENNINLSADIGYGEFGRIYYMKKKGDSWSDLIQVSEDSLGNSWDHDMVIDNSGRVYIFFNARDIYYRTYFDSVLSNPINVTNLDLNHYTAFEPKTLIDLNNNIYLTYILRDDDRDVTDVYYSKFDGHLWSDAVNISQIEDLSAWEQDITLDLNDNLYAVWQQQQTKLDTVLGIPTIVHYQTIFYSQSHDSGWSIPINISDIPKSSSYNPKIKIYKDKPLVFYNTIFENGDDRQINYSYQPDEVWTINYINGGSYIKYHFNFCISSAETLHFVTRSSPAASRAYIEYFRGFSIPTLFQEIDTKNRKSIDFEVYPNPFNNTTKIQFYLDKPDWIELNIYDITGKLVKTIISNKQLNSGMHFYSWDATNNQGKEVSSGIYFLDIISNSEYVISKKIILFK